MIPVLIKNRTVFEVEVNGRKFCLECPSESMWAEVSAVASAIFELSQEKIKAASVPTEEPKEEVEECQATSI